MTDDAEEEHCQDVLYGQFPSVLLSTAKILVSV